MKIKQGFVKTEAIGDDFVVVPVGEESTKTHRVITLNETAGFIYDGIAAGLDENAITAKLASEYAVPLEKAPRRKSSFRRAWRNKLSKEWQFLIEGKIKL